MRLTVKNYKILKIKQCLKNNKIFFLFNGINQDSYNLLTTKQELEKNTHFDYYKIFNKTSRNQINNSIYRNLAPTINGTTFIFEQKKGLKALTKHILLTNFTTFLFNILAIKFNNKIYSLKQMKSLYSLNYSENSLVLYRFGVTNLKCWFKFYI